MGSSLLVPPPQMSFPLLWFGLACPSRALVLHSPKTPLDKGQVTQVTCNFMPNSDIATLVSWQAIPGENNNANHNTMPMTLQHFVPGLDAHRLCVRKLNVQHLRVKAAMAVEEIKSTPPSKTLGPLGTSHERVNSLGYTHNGTRPNDAIAQAEGNCEALLLNHELNLCFQHLFECASMPRGNPLHPSPQPKLWSPNPSIVNMS